MIATFRQVAAAGVVAVLSCGGLVACGSATPQSARYTYDPGKAAVEVDTPALRRQKAKAAIENCPESAAGASQQSDTLPQVTLPCLGGGPSVDLATLTGQPTVLNFWAQTCGPCRRESPLFQGLHETGKVRVLGVDFYDPLPSRALAFADELGLTYPQLADPEAATRAPLHISGLPVTFFLDERGVVQHVEYGAVQSSGDLARMVSTYLGVDVATD
ncbi:MAG: TlpA disulfide reductase family protein [Nocardioidaceae bacterium]